MSELDKLLKTIRFLLIIGVIIFLLYHILIFVGLMGG